jgi:hypothetical protein
MYVRIKKTLSGGYIMIYQDAIALSDGNIYFTHSKDLKNWDDPQILFGMRSIFGGTAKRRYHTADAIVLQNGDILVAASYQANGSRGATQETKGLAIIRSNDGGYTWSEEIVPVYARNWEPSFLQLPSGEIHLYYTSSASYFVKFPGQSLDKINSGTALLRSFDNGYTWTPIVAETPYEGYRIINLYSERIKNLSYYTGQMPVAILLNDGKTIACAVETQIGSAPNAKLDSAIAYSTDNWAKPLPLDINGPTDYKATVIPNASAPYIRQFPSGETLFAGGYRLKLGDAAAREFQSTMYSIQIGGYAMSLELLSPHIMLDVYNTTAYSNDFEDNTIELKELYLNHRITAGKMTPTLDGANDDWKDNTEALFVGSDSQAQQTMRFAYDANNIYIITERLDRVLTDDDTTEIYFTASDANDLNGAYHIKVGQTGLVLSEKYAYGSFDPVTIEGIETAIYSKNTGNADEKGYNIEIKIPKASIGMTGNVIKTAFFLNNRDEGTQIITDKFFNAKTSSVDGWIKVQLTINN